MKLLKADVLFYFCEALNSLIFICFESAPFLELAF